MAITVEDVLDLAPTAEIFEFKPDAKYIIVLDPKKVVSQLDGTDIKTFVKQYK